MKEGALELVFILDRSGSMYGLTDDTIGGYNAVLDKQKSEKNDIVVTTVLFNSRSTILHDRVPAAEVPHITRDDYEAHGTTALYDAVGSAIDHIESIHRYIRPEDIPEKTLFVITTDGRENASHLFTREQVRMRIEKKRTESGWEFIFLAANIDTDEAAGDIGIDRSRAAGFTAESRGIRLMYQKLDRAIDQTILCSRDAIDWEAVLRDDEEN